MTPIPRNFHYTCNTANATTTSGTTFTLVSPPLCIATSLSALAGSTVTFTGENGPAVTTVWDSASDTLYARGTTITSTVYNGTSTCYTNCPYYRWPHPYDWTSTGSMLTSSDGVGRATGPAAVVSLVAGLHEEPLGASGIAAAVCTMLLAGLMVLVIFPFYQKYRLRKEMLG